MDRADRVGYGISAALHLGVIAWVLLGGSWFKPKPSEPIVLSEVSVISEAEFAAMVAAAPAPSETEVTPPEVPTVEPAPVDAPTPEPEVAPEPPPEPLPEPVAEPEPQPDMTDLTEPPPEPVDVTEVPPEMMPPVEVPQDTIAPEFSPRPKPKPAPRVAPTPAEAPEPDAKVSDLAQAETRPDKDAAPAEEVEKKDEAAPPEATTEIVTEATKTEEKATTSAPKSSPRPRAKPTPPKPAPKADTPKPAAPAVKKDAVNDALAEAMKEAGGTGTGGTGRAPSGPPVTSGEKEALIVDVKRCWNVGALSSEALRTSVTVSVSMGPDAKPDIGSIRMVGYEGGSEAAAKQAYEAGRRAIVRCGSDGFPLPPEKYDHWKEIEIVFNPEKMRMK
ncbi:hypothetical protein RYZ20_12045 [Thioclava sp. A2]|uniref:hypothetical protein n=1 Tax=Thioclava sp. FCG-A2 TaxID=3080562 RepID=UPI002952B9E1|nr:hypothetical protein [Thioclava sp. A2]MDV7271632.1 hypothetical protein [Thioclava sp. A2]